MFSKGTAEFSRGGGANDFVGDRDGGFNLKESRYQSHDSKIQLNKLDHDEEKAVIANSAAHNGPDSRVDLLGRPIPGSRNRFHHSERYRRLQLSCYNFLERPRGLAIVYHVAICILVIVSLILTALSTVAEFRELLETSILIVEIILVLIFAAEYCLRIWAAGCRSIYVGIKGRLSFAKKTYAILDIIVIVSSIAALSLATQNSTIAVRFVRFLPLLRVLRFDRQGSTWKLLASVIYIHRKELLTTLYLGFISLIFASFVLYMVEKDENVKFDSWPNSFWWGIVTLTTVGYGDKTPITWYGRLCAAVFAVCGISFFALPAGILGSGFALKVTQQQRQKHFHRRRRPAAILLQSYWRMYCADIQSKSVATWLPHIYYGNKNSPNPATVDKTASTTTVENQLSAVPSPRKGRKLSAVWKNRGEGKTSRSQSADLTKSNKLDSLENFRKGSMASTLDTGFFDEANISLSEDGETAITLSNAQKHAIRLIRLLKLKVAVRKFKEARRPYDVKDVIEQYSTGHVEMLARMRNLQQKLERISNTRDTEDDTKSSFGGRLIKVEHQVNVLDQKMDIMLSMLSRLTGTENVMGDGQFMNPNSGGPGPPGNCPRVQRTFSDPTTDSRTVTPLSINELPEVVVGAGTTASLPERCRSDSFPVSGSIPKYTDSPASHSQSFPALHVKSDLDSACVLNPLWSSQSSEESLMDHLIAPGESSSGTSRLRGIHERQLSDVTEGDESVGSDSKENVLHKSLSSDMHLASIGEDDNSDSEPGSPSEMTTLGPFEPYDPNRGDTSDGYPLVWEKKSPEGPRRRRMPSSKTSSESSCGTLLAEGSRDHADDLLSELPLDRKPDIYLDGDEGSSGPEVPGASLDNVPPEGASPIASKDDSITSVPEGRSKRRMLQRTSPIEV